MPSAICDYVTLNYEDAIAHNFATYLFNIPSSAYHNDARGPHCFVSVAEVCFQNIDQIKTVTIMLDDIGIVNGHLNNSAFRQTNTRPYVKGTPVVSFNNVSGTSADDDLPHLQSYRRKKKSDITQYKCDSQPSSIVLSGFSQDNAGRLRHFNVCSGPGYITLKFEYYTDEEYKRSQYGDNYTPAFPVPLAF